MSIINRYQLIMALTILGLFTTRCGLFEKEDSNAPEVAISSPMDGAEISGSITLRAVATDDVGVIEVSYEVDGNPIGAASSSPWEVDWDTGDYADGLSHTLIASAEDDAGNVGQSQSVRVTIVPSVGAVQGIVTDLFGSPVADATVTVGYGLDDRTSSAGAFMIEDVPVGTQSLEVSRVGFDTWQEYVTIYEAQTTNIFPALEPAAIPSGAMLASRVISYTANSMTFEIDIVVVDENAAPILNLDAAVFVINDTDFPGDIYFDFTPVSVIPLVSANAGPYSASLLIDQSGSITGTDPGDSRIQASKIFLSALGAGDNAQLAAFASGGYLPFSPLTIYGQGFTSNGASFYTALDDLAGQEGGGTPLYSSVLAMIEHTASNGPNANKAVIVFTDGEDTQGGATLYDIANAASNNGVKVFTVGLSSSVNFYVLAQMANLTGGAFMMTDDAEALISYYGTLGNLLHGSANFYRTRWSLTTSTDVFAPGVVFYYWLHVTSTDPWVVLNIPFSVDTGFNGGQSKWEFREETTAPNLKGQLPRIWGRPSGN